MVPKGSLIDLDEHPAANRNTKMQWYQTKSSQIQRFGGRQPVNRSHYQTQRIYTQKIGDNGGAGDGYAGRRR